MFVSRTQYKDLFCERFGCPASEFEKEAFRKFLFAHAKPFATLIQKLWPDFFVDDFKFIRYLGRAASLREAIADSSKFQEMNDANRIFLRSALKIRVSGRKATHLARELFAAGGERYRA
jgi:hypothetical protein